MTADTETSGAITPENLAKVIANLDEYIAERAGRMAEAALARAKAEADERVRAVREDLSAQLTRQEDLVAELRRQLEVQVRKQTRANQSSTLFNAQDGDRQ